MKQAITPENVWQIIERLEQKRFMTNPFFLIMNCEYEEVGGETLVYWKWTPETLIYAPKNFTLAKGKSVWCLKDDLVRLQASGLPIKSNTPDSTEFFYQTRHLIELKGADYKKMRNKIHAARKKYAFTFHDDCPADEAKAIINDWHAKTIGKKSDYQKTTVNFEVESALTMVDLLPSLPRVRQLAVRLDGKLVGYSLFCPLYKDFWVSVIQKTDRKYRNLAKVMYHEKCKRMADFPSASFGDDAKDPALTAAKAELHPSRTEVAYLVEL